MNMNALKQGKNYDNVTAEKIFELAKNGDITAKTSINEMIEILSRTLAGIVNTIDCNQVIVGGGLSEAGDDLLIPLRNSMEKYIFQQIRGNYYIKKAKLGNDAGLLGSVYKLITQD